MFMMLNMQRFMLVIVMIAWGSPDCLNSITEFIGKLPLHCMFVPRMKNYMYGRLCLWKFLPLYFVCFYLLHRGVLSINFSTKWLIHLCDQYPLHTLWSIAFMLSSIIQLNQTVNTGKEISSPITNNEIWWPFEPVDFSENLIIFI